MTRTTAGEPATVSGRVAALAAAAVTADADAVLAAGSDATAVVDNSCALGHEPAALASAGLSRAMWDSARTLAPFLVSDVIALMISGLIARAVLGFFLPAAASSPWLAAVSLFPLIAGYWLSGIYSEIWIHPVIEFRQLTHVSTIGLLAAAAGGFLAPPLMLWAGAAWVCAVMLVPLLRTIARAACENRPWWGFPTLIVSSGDGADEVVRLVLDCPRSGLRPVMMTDPHGQGRSSFMRAVNDPAALASMLRAEGVRHAVVSLPNYSFARLSAVLDRYSNLVPHLLVITDTGTLPTLWGASRSGGRLSGIEVRNGLLLATLQSLKRVVDLAVAGAVFIAGLPLLLVIAAAIKICTPGPVFFGHTRIGRHGQTFKAWKFRTMYVNGDEILRRFLERVAAARDEWDRDQKLRDDPRVTPLGRLLRRTSLDELPQIWNVLRGDMSIVGPRPIVDAEIPRYGEVFRLYTRLKPGITGLWQVSGRNNVSYEDRVRLDQFYIRHWSPWLDVYILAKTAVALIRRDGAC